MERIWIRRVWKNHQGGVFLMVRKLLTAAIITAALATAACNTVRGAATDVNSAANAVDNAT